MNRDRLGWVVMAVAVILAGCRIGSINPVHREGELFDGGFLGAWVEKAGKDKDRDKVNLLVVSPGESASVYRIEYTGSSGVKGEVCGWLVPLAGIILLEVAPNSGAGNELVDYCLIPAFSLFAIERKTDTVSFRLLDRGVLAKYLSAHPSEIEFNIRGKDEDVFITSGTDKYRAFLEKYLKERGVLEKEPHAFRRVK